MNHFVFRFFHLWTQDDHHAAEQRTAKVSTIKRLAKMLNDSKMTATVPSITL